MVTAAARTAYFCRTARAARTHRYAMSARTSTGDVPAKRVDHIGEYLAARSFPEVGVEDLHLDRAVVARSVDTRAQMPVVDRARAGKCAPEQGIGQRYQLVADVKAADAVAGLGDRLLDDRIPPHVELVDHDTDHRRGVRRCEIQRLSQRREHRAVGALHRMQR